MVYFQKDTRHLSKGQKIMLQKAIISRRYNNFYNREKTFLTPPIDLKKRCTKNSVHLFSTAFCYRLSGFSSTDTCVQSLRLKHPHGVILGSSILGERFEMSRKQRPPRQKREGERKIVNVKVVRRVQSCLRMTRLRI